MAKVNLGVQLDVNTRNMQGWKLGTATVRFTDRDINKAVVLDKTNEASMKLAADGDEIRGFIESIEPATADGATFGTVIRHAAGVRVWVTGTGLAVGDLVVAATQSAAGTVNALMGHPQNGRGLTPVKKGTPATFKWEVIRAKGTNVFLIEAV